LHRAILIGCTLALASLLAACGSAPAPPPPAPISSSEQCLRDLGARGVEYHLAAMPAATAPCEVETPVEVASTGLAWNRPGLVSCAMADVLDRFTVEQVEPMARRYLGTNVIRLDQIGAYSCRRIIGSAPGWSAHASGRAIDIAGFDLAGGGNVTVERDWHDAGARGAFLHAVALAACSYFNIVLTPESNQYHYNHMHLDIGPGKLCEADGRHVWHSAPAISFRGGGAGG
jgi:hypothetical protein